MKTTKKDKPNFKNFNEFFEFYLREHSNPKTRLVHVIGTLAGVAFFIYCLLDRRPLWIPLSLVIAYLINWSSHIFVEHNTPVTFRYYRLWSMVADIRMVLMILTGRLKLRP